MRIYRDLSALPASARGAAVAIGNFDGLHRGHRAVLDTMQCMAHERGLPSAVLTFAPHPRRFFSPEAPPLALEPFHVRARRLRALGVQRLYIARFDASFATLSASRFVHEVLAGQLEARGVVTGENFVFGHRRSGDAAFLAESAREYGFAYSAVGPQRFEEGMYASSRVRSHLAAGEMEQAALILGRPYEMTGRVRAGAAKGRELGYPTANIVPHGLSLPAFGVYAVRYAVAEPLEPEAMPADWRPGVAYLGTRPTFGGGAPWLEVHGLAGQEALYGRRLRVQMLSFLRPDRYFDTAEALTAQIAQDVAQAERILGGCDA